MGYYVQINKSSVILKREKLPQIFNIWKSMNNPQYDKLKRGGSWSNQKQTAKWYSWMPENYDKMCDSALDVLDNLDFTYSINASGDVVIENYDNKTGQEDLFFVAIAHLLDDSGIVWVGEDAEIFEWEFKDGEMFVDGQKMENPFIPVVSANLIESKETLVLSDNIVQIQYDSKKDASITRDSIVNVDDFSKKVGELAIKHGLYSIDGSSWNIDATHENLVAFSKELIG